MDLREKLPLLEDAWWQYVNNGEMKEYLNPVIKRSWKRCNKYRLDPTVVERTEILDGKQLKEKQEQYGRLLQLATPVMKQLYKLVKGSGFTIVLTDPQGYILQTITDPGFEEDAKRVKLVAGANWQERTQGTNAIGTVIEEKEPLTIFAMEHFLEKNHELTCSAAPIRDNKGQLMAVLNMTGNYRVAHPHTLAIIQQNVNKIEEKFKQDRKTADPNKIYGFSRNNSRQQPNADYSFEQIIGNSQKIKKLKEVAKRVALTDSTVLISGETGTGKELLAHSIHNYSSRRNKPFVTINCSAIPDKLMESELFGYVEGAFTDSKKGGKIGKFELADGGTIFLDEISELSLANQARLLRILEEKKVTPLGSIETREVDVRIISATNRSLLELVEENKFRNDLYYRLNVVNLKIPPLRERRDDIILLAKYFLRQIGMEMGRGSLAFEQKVLRLFQNYDWPGNVRELKNVIRGTLSMMSGSAVRVDDLPDYLTKQKENFASNKIMSLTENEREHIIKVLNYMDCNISQAARKLGIGRNTLYRKIKKYRIDICSKSEH